MCMHGYWKEEKAKKLIPRDAWGKEVPYLAGRRKRMEGQMLGRETGSEEGWQEKRVQGESDSIHLEEKKHR